MPSCPNKLYPLARMYSNTVGTGVVTLTTNLPGYLTWAAAGAQNNDIVSYVIRDGVNSEAGWGVYTAATTSFTRNVVASTNANALISLSGNSAECDISPLPGDIVGALQAVNNLSEIADPVTAGFNLGIRSRAVADRTALAALDPTKFKAAFIYGEGGRNGYFVLVTGTTPTNDPSQGVYVASGTAGFYWMRVYDGAVNVKWFGAKADNSADDKAAIQAAISFFTAGFGTVWLPSGFYRVTGQININYNGINIRGDGKYSTVINLDVSAAASLFRFEYVDGVNILYDCSVKDMSFYSQDTAHQKVVFDLVDTSAFQLHSVGTTSFHWYGAQSIFVRFQGREIFSGRDWDVAADTPIYLLPVPITHLHRTVGIDHHNFHNMYLVGNMPAPSTHTSPYPLIYVADGLHLTNVSFTGFQAWVGGTHAFQWDDTSSAAISYNVLFENVRSEQALSATAYTWYFNKSAATCRSVTFRNCYPDTARKGAYLRRIDNVSFETVNFDGFNLIMDADTTVASITGKAVSTQTGASINIVGLTMKEDSGASLGPLPRNFFYDQLPASPVTVGPAIRGKVFSVPYQHTAAFDIINGIVLISCDDQTQAIYCLTLGLAAQEFNDWRNQYSPHADTPGQHNIYWDGVSKYLIQNNMNTDTRTYTILQMG